MKKLLCILLAILLIPTTLAFVGCDKESESAYEKLGETEKKVYTLTLNFSYSFKNPSSVKIISGHFYNSAEYFGEESGYYELCFRLQAQNGFEATNTHRYYLMGNIETLKNNFIIDLEDGSFVGEDYKLGEERLLEYQLKSLKTDDFDYSAVNNALKEYWEKQGI